MRKNIFATGLVVLTLLVSTRCSEDEIVADNQTSQAAAEQDRESESGRKKTGKSIATPITGTINGIAFAADYRIREFVAEGDVLYAVGSLSNISGTGLPAEVSNLVGQTVRMPVELPAGNSTADASAAAIGSCDILFLQLGPLDLDLLGLQVHLDQVTLNIDAATGSGNLLGNLLCAVTGLLDGVGSLVAIAQLLNQIIGIIGTIG